MVGEVGLEPTKAFASGFTVRPLCHSGHSPIHRFVRPEQERPPRRAGRSSRGVYAQPRPGLSTIGPPHATRYKRRDETAPRPQARTAAAFTRRGGHDLIYGWHSAVAALTKSAPPHPEAAGHAECAAAPLRARHSRSARAGRSARDRAAHRPRRRASGHRSPLRSPSRARPCRSRGCAARRRARPGDRPAQCRRHPALRRRLRRGRACADRTPRPGRFRRARQGRLRRARARRAGFG